MKTFSIREAVQRGWELFKAHKKLLLLGTLIYLFFSMVSDIEVHILVAILLFIIDLIVQIGWWKVLLQVLDGRAARLKEIFSHGELFFKYLASLILMVIIAALPFILPALAYLVLPANWAVVSALASLSLLGAVYLSIKYGFALVLVLDKDEMKITEAFSKSARMTEGVKWKLVGFSLVILIINIVGVLAIVVGLLVSIPVSLLAYLHVYRTLESRA